jgi:hypothetical protein
VPVQTLVTLASLLVVPPFMSTWEHVNVHDDPAARLVGAIDFACYAAVRGVPESYEEVVGNLVGRELVRGLRKGMTPQEVQAVLGRLEERGCVGHRGGQVEFVIVRYDPEGIQISYAAHGTPDHPALDRVTGFRWSPGSPVALLVERFGSARESRETSSPR